MRLIKKFCLLLAFLFCVCFFGCTEKPQPLSFWAFNTEVIIAGQEKPLSRAVENQIRTLFSDLEKEFALDSDSSFSKSFNSASVGSTLALSDHALNVMLFAKTAYALSDGFFDPTVYPLVKLWGFNPYQFTPQFNPPSSEQISTLLPNVNFNSIVLNEQQKTVTKTENVQLDLGGIVKGYASMLAKNILRENGYKKGYISVGGSSLSLLNSKSLGVRHPRATTEVLFTVNCSNYNFVDLSTSGDYEKYHVGIDGKRYCHLINPFTGTPTNTGVASATIIGVDGAISDALTTALCLLPHQKNEPNSPLIEKINAIIQTYPNCSIYLVFDNGNDKLLITNKTQDIDFTLRDADYSVVKI